MEFSKSLAKAIFIVYGVLIYLSVFLITFKNANLLGLIGIVTPIPIAVVGFYYQKSKEENLVKIANSSSTSN